MRKRSIARFGKDFAQVADVLGCFERDPNAYLMERRDLKAARTGLDVAKVESLVADRRAARDTKDWGRADEIRDELDKLGVKIRDAGDETIWSL